MKQSRTNINSKTVGKNTKDILKQSLGNKNKVKNPITKIGKKIPIKPTVYSKVANVAKSLGPKGRAVALGALAVGAIATAVANRKKKDKTGSYQFNINKPSPGQSYIKGIPKARVDKPDSAQVSKPKKGSWNDRQLKMTKEEVAIANSMGGGGIAGSVEAGDNPPVNKKKKKGEPTIIARGCMPGARGRFKGGVELLASFKKNKYT